MLEASFWIGTSAPDQLLIEISTKYLYPYFLSTGFVFLDIGNVVNVVDIGIFLYCSRHFIRISYGYKYFMRGW